MSAQKNEGIAHIDLIFNSFRFSFRNTFIIPTKQEHTEVSYETTDGIL